MTIFHDELSILFQIFTDECKEGVSHTCADDGIDDEFGQVHLSHSRRQRNQMPDDWDESTDEDGDASSSLEEVFRAFQFLFIEKKIFSESSDERFASVISDRIRQ